MPGLGHEGADRNALVYRQRQPPFLAPETSRHRPRAQFFWPSNIFAGDEDDATEVLGIAMADGGDSHAVPPHSRIMSTTCVPRATYTGSLEPVS